MQVNPEYCDISDIKWYCEECWNVWQWVHVMFAQGDRKCESIENPNEKLQRTGGSKGAEKQLQLVQKTLVISHHLIWKTLGCSSEQVFWILMYGLKKTPPQKNTKSYPKTIFISAWWTILITIIS